MPGEQDRSLKSKRLKLTPLEFESEPYGDIDHVYVCRPMLGCIISLFSASSILFGNESFLLILLPSLNKTGSTKDVQGNESTFVLQNRAQNWQFLFCT